MIAKGEGVVVVWTLVRRDSAIYGAKSIIFFVGAINGAVPTD